MLKLVFGIALFALSSFFGINYKKKCKERSRFYKELYEFVLHLTEQISYAKTPLPQIIKSFAMLKESVLGNLLKEYTVELEKGEQLEYSVKYLNEREKQEVLSFFRGLGKTDAENQITSLGESKQWINSKKEHTQKEELSKGNLYYKLAIIIGIALLIIVI